MVGCGHVECDGRVGRNDDVADRQRIVGNARHGDVRGGVVPHGFADDGVEIRGVREVRDARFLVAQNGEDLLPNLLLEVWVSSKEVDGGRERARGSVLRRNRCQNIANGSEQVHVHVLR